MSWTSTKMNSKLLQHNMNRFKKRERTQNWAYEEKRFLLELCRKDMKIIENKRLDSSLTAIKNRAWRIIHQQFTSTFGTDRDCNRLKEQWRRMKACTRAEIIDYQHRITRYGQEIADRKRPSPFTFEIWEFMQEAKRACKNGSMDDIDYSKMKLSLEEEYSNDMLTISDEMELNQRIHHDASCDVDEVAYAKDVGPPNMCEVEIKEEVISGHDEFSPFKIQTNNNRRVNHNEVHHDASNNLELRSNRNLISMSPSLSINNLSATYETLNMLKNQISFGNKRKSMEGGGGGGGNDKPSENEDCHTKQYIEMQTREHLIRMQILKIELETAKFNRDTAELNRRIALKKFNECISPDS